MSLMTAWKDDWHLSSAEDTGFSELEEFSQDSQEEDEEEVLSPVERNFEELITKYLDLATKGVSVKHIGDPFSSIYYNFDELLQLLVLAAERASLAVCAQLLDTAVGFLHEQIEFVRKSYQNIASGIGISPKKVSQSTRLSEDSGYFSQSLERISPSASLSETAPACREGSLKKSKQMTAYAGKFLAQENAITFHVENVAPDVISRRKRFQDRLYELAFAKDSFNCSFNFMHKEYGSELYSRVSDYANGEAESDNKNVDAASFLKFLTLQSRSKVGMQPLLRFLTFDGAEDVLPQDQPDENSSNLPELTSGPIESYEGSENDVGSENVQPLAVGEDSNISPPVLEESLLTVIEPGDAKTESSGKMPKSKGRKKGRGPLGSLNMATNQIIHETEVKRARLDGELESNRSPGMLMECHSIGGNTDDIIPDMPDLLDGYCDYSELSGMESELLESSTVAEMSFRAPSPLLDRSNHPTSFTRSDQINIDKVKRMLGSVVDNEFQSGTAEEINFLELIQRSNVCISQRKSSSEEAILTATAEKVTASIHHVFFALLELAGSKGMFLIPTSDDLFKITTKMPMLEPGDVMCSDKTQFEKRLYDYKHSRKLCNNHEN